jgi:hypothetical protein
MKARIIAAALLPLMLLSTSAPAEEEQPPLVFGTAPTSSVEETRKAYATMINYLTQAIGRRVVLQTAENYQEYQVKMRNGEFDLAFDGPPFVSWRMDRMGHVPLVKLPAEIRIIVIKREDSKYNTLEELGIYNVNTCVVPPPNTLTLIFLHYFPHPARQPNLLPIEGFKNIENCIRSGKGEVAVFRDIYWKKMDQTGLKVLYEPGIGYPERAISAGPKITEELRNKITEALISDEGAAASKDVLSRFQRDKFVKATVKDFEGQAEMLRPVWGFH